jgi:hypothetical protein
MTDRKRVNLHMGIPEGAASMPTCGACRQQIGRGTTYASVPCTPELREVRHNTADCLRWLNGKGSDLTEGALINSIRYSLSEWGGQLVGVITQRTEETNEFGWRGYMVAPADSSDTGPLDRLRNHREEFFRKMAETLTIDPEPRMVYISDDESTHYVPPTA